MTKRKITIGTSIILTIIITIIVIVFLVKENQTYTFEEISGVNVEDIAYIVNETTWKDDENEIKSNTEDFKSSYKNAIFKGAKYKYHESMMAIEKFVAYDKNDNKLFTIYSGNDWSIEPVKETNLPGGKYIRIK